MLGFFPLEMPSHMETVLCYPDWKGHLEPESQGSSRVCHTLEMAYCWLIEETCPHSLCHSHLVSVGPLLLPYPARLCVPFGLPRPPASIHCFCHALDLVFKRLGLHSHIELGLFKQAHCLRRADILHVSMSAYFGGHWYSTSPHPHQSLGSQSQ